MFKLIFSNFARDPDNMKPKYFRRSCLTLPPFLFIVIVVFVHFLISYSLCLDKT